MDTDSARKPWFRKTRYIVLILFVVILLIAALFQVGPATPKTRAQVALDGAITYFVTNYNYTLGLIPESPGSQVYWLTPDNYFAGLALTRFSSSNQTTLSFGSALYAAVTGYDATIPGALLRSQYTALNSTSAYFSCPTDYAISWSTGGQAAGGNGSAVLMTTVNNQSPLCASQNYADLYFLQAIYYHRLGNTTAADSFYQSGAKDFDGEGFVDLVNQGAPESAMTYQTSKVALYVYATICLGEQTTATNLAVAESTLLHMQVNSTGGFAATYGPNLTALNAPSVSPTSGVNTETTALAALALELMVNPSASC